MRPQLGRLQSKIDAKGQKATYSCDGYGRLAYIDRYPNGTTWDPCQSVALTYDATAPNANGLGRISTAATGAYWALGLSDSTTCGGQSVTEQYGYTPGGLVTSKSYTMTRPTVLSPLYFATSGATAGYSYDNEGHMSGYGPFTYTLDAMGRPTGMTENGVGTVWVQNAAYGPGGEMKTMQYRIFSGEWYTETQTFNNRSQLIRRQGSGKGLALDLQYGYTAGANNGQIATSSEAVSGEQVAYTYDSLKRLIKAETTANPGGPAWGQSFGYDGFGNLLTKNQTPGHTGTQMSLTVNPATNYLTTSGFAYDANGNMTSMPATGGNIALGYDVENRTGGQWFDQQNQPLLRAGVWNLYGLHGERLETHTFGSALIVINGQLLGTYGTQPLVTRNIYFAGRLIRSNGKTVATDRLGSVRSSDDWETFGYYPYGEEVIVKNPQDREKFATYTRESSTGLDYAASRYYTSTYGRFNTADRNRGSVVPTSPGSWNTCHNGSLF